MNSTFKRIIKNISVFDIIAFITIFVGIIFAIVLDEIAFKLIAVCISFLSALALVSSLTQKFSYKVEPGKFNIKSPSEQLITTTVNNEQAKHTTIDNFNESPDSESGVQYDENEGFVVFTRKSPEQSENPIKHTPIEYNTEFDTNKFDANIEDSFVVIPRIKQKMDVPFDDKEKIDSIIDKADKEIFLNIKEATTNRNFNDKNINDRTITNKVTSGISSKVANLDSNEFTNEFTNEFISGVADNTVTNKITSSNVADNAVTNKVTSSGVADNIVANKITSSNVRSNVFSSNLTNAGNNESIAKERNPVISNLEFEKTPENTTNEAVTVNLSEPTFRTITSENLADQKTLNEKKNKISATDIPINLIVDFSKDHKTKTPIEEFAYLISRCLIIIRSVLETKTVSVVWVNNENNTTLLFDSYLSDNSVKDFIINDLKIEIGNDIISQIVQNSKPQILSNINPVAELDLIPYYSKPVGIKSFIGIPIFFEDAIVGVLCADSDVSDVYDLTTATFLGNFSKLVSILFGAYSNYYSAQIAKKTLKLVNRFSELASEKDCNSAQICTLILDLITEFYDFSSLGICIYDDKKQAWFVTSYKSINNNVDENFFKTPILPDTSLIGICISKCQTISLSNVPNEYIRVNKYEPILNNGAFFAIPIKSIVDTYGALFIEGQSDILSNVEIDILDAVCNSAGEIFEKIQLTSLFNYYVNVESRTGILTAQAFRKRLNEEVLRSNETNQIISLALIALDKYSTLDTANKKLKIFDNIITIVNNYLKPYDAIGRVNADVLGIIFFNKDANTTKLILERIRQYIATQLIDIGTEELVITISAGIATIKQDDTFDIFTSNATMALHSAQKRSNCVQVFS